mmetsp:Transcript_21887/g.36237  ORF Transcript_21887/g.36237 Transcript_21887/m.36237 type:complete len:1190 (-) Transcript_21887:810-4379(-)|eukprot:CAMPEP_0184660112 /NCGR_PEP_ID=MMETSP0308-20130426/32505_1 /TAXON_ID=38269 /ORGANISM="Gloeochaete witrockiana, Strain SAG 46.84" /LENGTH=1189 /DNA_ID=CAMNT_0027100461 /DNA_START=22 /DNA_END=3591 /DNA_ORIENTATION=+
MAPLQQWSPGCAFVVNFPGVSAYNKFVSRSSRCTSEHNASPSLRQHLPCHFSTFCIGSRIAEKTFYNNGARRLLMHSRQLYFYENAVKMVLQPPGKGEISTADSQSTDLKEDILAASREAFAQSQNRPSRTVQTIGIPKEIHKGEKRVAITPASVVYLKTLGLDVVIESGAGAQAMAPDSHYEAAGARIAKSTEEVYACDLIVKVRAPEENAAVGKHEADLIDSHSAVVSFLYPAFNKELVSQLEARGVTYFAMDCVPRTTRAQELDALSSTGAINGTRAMIEAASALLRYPSGQMTAAGKYPPAKVLIVGAGVAGLAAIGVGRALGAEVRAFDTRPAAAEQVQSMGATFLTITEEQMKEMGGGVGGYAKEMSQEFIDAEMALFMEQAKEVDIIITTALIPGRKAPLLITKEHVAAMKPGSVVVDMAAEMGGNCEVTKAGESYRTENGVQIVGFTDLASRYAVQASQMYSNNVCNLLKLIVKDQKLDINYADEVVRGLLVLHDGDLKWPPPPIEPSPAAKPAAAATAAATTPAAKEAKVPKSEKKHHAAAKPSVPAKEKGLFDPQALGLLAASSGLIATGVFAPASFLPHFTVLTLAIFVGYQVVWNVTPSLHSPLMSVTNAISGIIVLGGMLGLHQHFALDDASGLMSAIAILISMINVTGGFLISKRMLSMFRRGDETESAGAGSMNTILLPALLFIAAQFGLGYALPPGMSLPAFASFEYRPEVAYMVSAVLFILSLGGLSNPETAQRGNVMGMLGMGSAIAATAVAGTANPLVFSGAAGIGAAIGASAAAKVDMVALPQLVAGFHSFVGAAATMIGIASYLSPDIALASMSVAEEIIHKGSIWVGVVIGALTFTGSVVAFGKLKGNISGKPLYLPYRHFLNLAAILGCVALGVPYMTATGTEGLAPLLGITALSSMLGIHMVMAIGGADMPVVVSMLNSYSGWATAADGFIFGNDLLIVTGALVGASGAILSYIMCKAMNRNFFSVIAGGFGTDTSSSKAAAPPSDGSGEVQSVDIDGAAELLRNADSVIIVPGYGMAVAQAQRSVAQVTDWLRSEGKTIRFGIHPVAGRLPGHMNVLLAEANVPYDLVFEMDELNDEFDETDVAMVIGANDIVNPSAEDDPTSPIAGMPVLKVWNANTCIVLKRSMASGYAGVDNPLFVKTNTRMLFGDAKKVMDSLSAKLASS